MLSLVSYQRWMWDELWRWQCWRRAGMRWDQGAEPPRELWSTRPPEPERALFVADLVIVDGKRAGTFAAGIALHETKAYVFLDDLTTNPGAPLRLRHAGATLVLAIAKQYCLSVGKPAVAFTSHRGLYKIARRLGFDTRPSGALLVFQAPSAPLDSEGENVIPSGSPRSVWERPVGPLRDPSYKKSGPVAKPARSTVDGENVYRSDRHPSNGNVPRQVVKRIVKTADGKTISVVKRVRPLPNR